MKQLAVHLHLFYLDQLPRIIKYLHNLDNVDYDLFITMVEENSIIRQQLLSEFPNAQIWIVENRGYDIGPFIDFLHKINLDSYKYVLKLHTKRLLKTSYCYFNKRRFNFKTWSKILYETLLGNKQIVSDNIKYLEQNKHIGMLSSKHCIISETIKFDISNFKQINQASKSYTFVAGTMFYVRAELLKLFQKYTISDFPTNYQPIHDHTLAHYLERLLGQSVINQGFEIFGTNNKSYYFDSIFATISRFIYQKTVTKHGNILIKILRIPVFRKQLPIQAVSYCQTFSKSPCKHKRLAIYAAYKKDGHIDNADIYYLKELKKVCDNIIYIADCNLFEQDAKKISNYVCYIQAKRHGEYDFGSYKIGFQYAKENNLLSNIEELILCNDSCYAPLSSFNKMFDKMKKSNCDFWGITENTEFSRHIQSYFLVFRPQIFNSNIFNTFISNISSQKNVSDVIQNYEIGLSNLLFKNSFSATTYIAYPKNNTYPLTLAKGFKNLTAAPIWLLKQGAPIIKKKAFTQTIANLEGIRKLKNYACKLNKNAHNFLPSTTFCIKQDAKNTILSIFRFFFQKKITQSGKLLIKICKIPVYSQRIQKV